MFSQLIFTIRWNGKICLPLSFDFEVKDAEIITLLMGLHGTISVITRDGKEYYTDIETDTEIEAIKFKRIQINIGGNKIYPKFKYIKGGLFFDEKNTIYCYDIHMTQGLTFRRRNNDTRDVNHLTCRLFICDGILYCCNNSEC